MTDSLWKKTFKLLINTKTAKLSSQYVKQGIDNKLLTITGSCGKLVRVLLVKWNTIFLAYGQWVQCHNMPSNTSNESKLYYNKNLQVVNTISIKI